jgi:hypothetical protein
MEDLVIEEEGTSSALKITLGDFLVFINWMNQTEKSLDRAEALPTLPDLDSGKVRSWIQLVQRLEERFRRVKKETCARSECNRPGSTVGTTLVALACEYRLALRQPRTIAKKLKRFVAELKHFM